MATKPEIKNDQRKKKELQNSRSTPLKDQVGLWGETGWTEVTRKKSKQKKSGQIIPSRRKDEANQVQNHADVAGSTTHLIKDTEGNGIFIEKKLSPNKIIKSTNEKDHELETRPLLQLEKNINQSQMLLSPQQIGGDLTNDGDAVKEELSTNDKKVLNLTTKSMNSGISHHTSEKSKRNMQVDNANDEWKECVKKQKKKKHFTSTPVEVRYFSLPNLRSDAIDSVKLNYAGTKLQPEVVAALPELLNGKEIKLSIKVTEIAQDNNEYTTAIPLLEEHREILSSIWNNVQAEDIVTSGRTYRALATNLSDTEYTLKKKNLNNTEVYILNFERTGSSQHSELYRRVYATIVKNIEDVPYSTYSYNTEEYLKYRVHYLSEEDVYEKKEFYEVKTFEQDKHLPNDYQNYISPRVAYKAAIQCMTRRSNKLIVGFYNDTHVTVKLYTLDELIHIAKEGDLKVAVAKKMLAINMKQIIQYIKENGELILDKTVIIKKDSKKLNFFVSE